MISIVENTLRDGSYAVNFQFDKKNTKDIVGGLDKLGFQYIEVGHGLGLGAWNNKKYGFAAEDDYTYIRTSKEACKNGKIAAFFIPGIGDEDDIKKAKENGLDFIRIGINIDNFKDVFKYAKLSKELGLMVSINLMKSYAIKSYEFSMIVEQIDKWGFVDVIYLVDSAGCMIPKEIAEYIDRSIQNVTTKIGFHGHNNLSLAIANSLQAMDSGARFIDTCIRGMGRSAGNAQTEIFVYLLHKQKIDLGIDAYELYDFSDNIIAPLMNKKQGLNSDEIHIGVSKFHSSYMPIVERAVKEFGIHKKKLIKKVSDINCLNPSQELFYETAKQMSDEE